MIIELIMVSIGYRISRIVLANIEIVKMSDENKMYPSHPFIAFDSAIQG